MCPGDMQRRKHWLGRPGPPRNLPRWLGDASLLVFALALELSGAALKSLVSKTRSAGSGRGRTGRDSSVSAGPFFGGAPVGAFGWLGGAGGPGGPGGGAARPGGGGAWLGWTLG